MDYGKMRSGSDTMMLPSLVSGLFLYRSGKWSYVGGLNTGGNAHIGTQVKMTDSIYHGLVTSRLANFFSKGWGDVQTYQKLLRLRRKIQNRTDCLSLVRNIPKINCKLVRKISGGRVFEGFFKSPLAIAAPGLLPEEAEIARFELILPEEKPTSHNTPVYIQLAGTGDHHYWRRRALTALPLLHEEQIGSLLVENPYYGRRKPPGQIRSSLRHVSDLLVMGAALSLECYVLRDWLQYQGLGPIGITGVSMGGHNASLAGALWPSASPVVPCFSWATAASVFTRGVLKSAVCWDALQLELHHGKLGLSNICQILKEHEEEHGTRELHDCDAFKVGSRRAGKVTYEEAMKWMTIVLDYWTHLRHFSIPSDPRRTVFVTAKQDKYVPREWAEDVRTIWPGCSVEYLDGGHVTAFLLQQKKLRKVLCCTMKDLIT